MSKTYTRTSEKDAYEFYETSKAIGFDVSKPERTGQSEWKIVVNDSHSGYKPESNNERIESAYNDASDSEMGEYLAEASLETDSELAEVKSKIMGAESRDEEKEYQDKYNKLAKIKKELSKLSSKSKRESTPSGGLNLKSAMRLIGIGAINKNAMRMYQVNPNASKVISFNTSIMGQNNRLKSLTMPPNMSFIKKPLIKPMVTSGRPFIKARSSSLFSGITIKNPNQLLSSNSPVKNTKLKLPKLLVKPKRRK